MRVSRSSEPRRKSRLTRLGLHFLFVGAFAMLGGALRGFNLLLVLAGLLVGALLVQWRWSRRSIESVTVRRRLPIEAFAEKPFRVRYLMRNTSRLMPVWLMRIEDKIRSVDRQDQATAVCGVGMIASQQVVLPYCQCVVARRGRYRFGPITVATTFPFALTRSSQIVAAADELYVFPKLLRLHGRWQHRLISRNGGMATTARRGGRSEGEFFGLREWQTGDSPKWIHWRTSARLPDPAVRKFEQQRRFDTCVMVDAYDRAVGDDAVEVAISLAATLVVHLVGSPSNRVVLAIAATESDAVVGGGSNQGKRRMLEMLAELRPSPRPHLADATRKSVEIVGHTQDLIVVSPRSFATAQAMESGLAAAIAPWTRRSCLRWIDVTDSELQRWVLPDAPRPEAVVTGNRMRPDALESGGPIYDAEHE